MQRRIATGGTCPTRKRRYRDHESAVRALTRIKATGEARRGKTLTRAYDCPACAGWHLTSQETEQ